MIEPYGTIIKSMLQEYRQLDLTIAHDTEYKMVLAAKDYSLVIATETNYQPSILACVTDRTGQEFEVGLSERVLASQKFEDDLKELQEIKDKYQLEAHDGNEHVKAIGIYIFVKVATRQIFRFVSEFSQEIVDENGLFRAEYLSREQALLKDLGLQS